MNIKTIWLTLCCLLTWGGSLWASTTIANDDFNPESPAEPTVISFCRINVTAEPEEGAYVSGGGKYVLNGSDIYISTNADNTSDYTYTFKYWELNGKKTSYSQNFYFTPESGTFNFVAHYEKKEVTFDPDNPAEPSAGNVKRNYHLYLKPTIKDACSFNMDSGIKIREGSELNLYVNLNAGYQFEGWELNGKVISTDMYLNFTMPGEETTLKARVKEIPFDPEDPIEPSGSTIDVDNATRQLMDIQVGDAGGYVDKTRIVINEAKSLNYEVGCDASKIISTDANYQIYSLDNKKVKYSVNERPRDDGLIPLGLIVRQAGEVTITATRLDRSALLIDKLLNKEIYLPTTSYTFTSEVGTFEDRFFIKLPENGTGETVLIKIGGKGLTTFTSKFNLDFSGFGDEVKAYVATGYDYDTKTIWLTRVKDVPAETALMVKGTANVTYEVPVKENSSSYYKNMFVGNTTGSTMPIGETSDGMTNYYLKDGQFLSVKGSAKINDGKSYLQIPTTAPKTNAGSSQTMTMNAYGFASYCGSQDLDFTDVEGLKAYAATGYDDATGTIWLTRVMRVSAGTPLLLKGAPSTEDKVSSYTVPSSAVSSYYTNMLKGNTSSEQLIINTTEGDMTNYYLKGNQLLKVSGTAKIGSGKAYMQIPSKHVTRAEEDVVSGAPYYNIGEESEVISMQVGTRGIDGDDDDTTDISEVKSDDADRGEWYNLQGQRVEHPSKGLYIKNGKKVLMK